MLEKIISGGQAGVDLAALDAAMALGIPYGGYCPKGRINENGKIPGKYKLLNEISGDYDARTKLNVQSSDGTLILIPKIPMSPAIKDGTILTIEEAKDQRKSFLMVDLSLAQSVNAGLIIDWVKENSIKILNIAGPRESNSPGIYQSSFNLLQRVLPLLFFHPD